MILAADYFWNGGGPAPDALGYDAETVFDALWKG